MSRNLFWLSDEEWGADRAAFADEFTRRGADRQRCSRQDGRSQTEGDFQGEQAVWLSQRIRAGDFTLRGLIAEPGGRGLKVDYRPAAKRDGVAQLRAALGLSERRACSIVNADRKMIRYRSCRPPDKDLREHLRDLANERKRFGYKIVEAERRGQKIKKKLDVDPVEAETVRLIFKLYLHGDGTASPLDVKETTKWLNSHGYRTRRGATFGVGPVHKILTNSCYATGQRPYGVRSSRDGRKYDPSTVIQIPAPALIEQADFNRVKAKLAKSNPKTTPPRVVNGPSLLTGIAVCASCGCGMTRYRHHQPAGPVVFVLLLRRRAAEGKDRLQGPAYSGGDAGRDRSNQL